MTNLLSRIAMAFLLATSCFLVTGCGDGGSSTPDKADTEASSDADGDAKEGSTAKDDSAAKGSDSK